ncbi:MAG: alpha/beta hydrolase [Anaerolineae bacterium]|nr:alpha/beta hydrolase [Anaerolineae bacterium]
MRKLKRWSGLLLLLFLLAPVGFVVWASTPSSPMPEALAALQSDSQVRVETKPWLIFRPVAGDPTVGQILYPGGRVDPRAYAPAARAIAAEGYLVVIVPMPLNLAVFGPKRAAEVLSAFPEVERWAIGGHSLGGAMAARFAHRQPSAVQGLVLWASYPAASDDLSARDLAVASIYGTRDGLATEEKIAASRALLPAETRWVAIVGGNHAQFGWYGPQRGDNSATISREVQQQEVVAATLALLGDLR